MLDQTKKDRVVELDNLYEQMTSSSVLTELGSLSNNLEKHFGLGVVTLTYVREQLKQVRGISYRERTPHMEKIVASIASNMGQAVNIDGMTAFNTFEPLVTLSFDQTRKSKIPGFVAFGDYRERKVDVFHDRLVIHTKDSDIHINYGESGEIEGLVIKTKNPEQLGIPTPVCLIRKNAEDPTRGNIRLTRGDNTYEYPLDIKPDTLDYVKSDFLGHEINYMSNGQLMNVRCYFGDDQNHYVVLYEYDQMKGTFEPSRVSMGDNYFGMQPISLEEYTDRATKGLNIPTFETDDDDEFTVTRSRFPFKYPIKVNTNAVTDKLNLYISSQFGELINVT